MQNTLKKNILPCDLWQFLRQGFIKYLLHKKYISFRLFLLQKNSASNLLGFAIANWMLTTGAQRKALVFCSQNNIICCVGAVQILNIYSHSDRFDTSIMCQKYHTWFIVFI